MSATPLALIWDLIARDKASPGFLRVAGAADKAAASTERATKSMGGAAARMGTVGAKLTKGVTVPLLGIAAVSVEQAAKYQKSLNTIQVATDRNNRQMARGSKGLLTIAKETGTTLDSLTDSFYVASKSGLSVAKSLKITRAAAQGAKAEGADLGVVTDALTSVMASYGKTLKNPVAAMNEIIKGSGLAKTTVQDFAASLSNVVPIASALHISFAQVAGAIATMTQHGETAQRATDNLSNLITNLAGQNNVAAGALGQLGINTIELSRNLGKRGLTGSLNLVLNAIAKHSKAGLVVTDAFRQSATATRSLRQELDAMPPALQKQSEAFDKGKLSYKDYYTFVKSLGGQQYQLGKGFIATEGTAKGFNQQLKSGNSTTSTLARTLQKALGGVTGMRTALMLSGNSAKTFANDTKEIGKVAIDAGADVLGWGKTQNTLAVKMDKAKASLQVLAVEIGTKLIPVVSKVVDKVTSAAHWFEHLSGTDKKVLTWSAGVLLALGPILSIGGKLRLLGGAFGTFATTAGTKLSLLAGSSEQTATRVGTAMRRATGAVSAAAVGMLAANITPNSSGGLLGSIFLGTAGGWAVGGPVGAAVGGISTAIFKGIGLWKDHSEAAQRAAAAEKQVVDTLTAAIEADNGALGAGLKLQVTKALQASGALSEAQKLGLKIGDVVTASMGKNPSFAKGLNIESRTLREQLAKYLPSGSTDFSSARNNINQMFERGQVVGGKITKISAGQRDFLLQDLNRLQGVSKLSSILGGLTGDIGKAKSQADQFAHAMNDDRVNAGGFGDQLQALRKHATIALDANGQLATGLNKTTVLGQHNQQMFKHLAVAARQDAVATLLNAEKHHSLAEALTIANVRMAKNDEAIRRVGTAAGFSGPKLDGILNTLNWLGKADAHPKVKVDGIALAESQLRTLQSQITGLHGKDLTIRLALINSSGVGQAGAQPGNPHSRNDGTDNNPNNNKAGGGFVFGRGTGTSDSINAKLSNGEFVVRAVQVRKHRAELEAINKGVAGFAGGGHFGIDYRPSRRPVPPAAGARPSRVRVFGKVAIDADSQGKLFADFRDIVLDELDFGVTLARMGS